MSSTDVSQLPRFWPSEALAVTCGLAKAASEKGGRLLIVGGAVRDALLGLPSGDLDLELFGFDEQATRNLFRMYEGFHYVGKSFPVWHHHAHEIDLALPREERPTGPRHQDFEIKVNPAMSFREAAARRDFTLNAIAYDPLAKELIDPWNGLEDLESRSLRHVSPQFSEDPLRVLRSMQFIARFELKAAPETLALCRSLSSEHLPIERVGGEWEKLLLKGVRPSLGLRFLRDCGWIHDYPELKALINCPQDPTWHPEGDVWNHTLLALDATVPLRTGGRHDDLVMTLAVLCHDFGKPTHTHFIEGRWRSPGHEMAGTIPTRSFLQRLTREQRIIEDVIPLVETHMRPYQLFLTEASDSAVRRLALKVRRLDLLIRVATADTRGRGGPPDLPFPAGEWLQERAEALALADQQPQPLLLGRHLLELGYAPGPELGQHLKRLFEQQLDGAFDSVEAGLNYARKHLPAP